MENEEDGRCLIVGSRARKEDEEKEGGKGGGGKDTGSGE